jgi:hypothetical protein
LCNEKIPFIYPQPEDRLRAGSSACFALFFNIFAHAYCIHWDGVLFLVRQKSKPFEMKNRIVQLTHRYPALEYVYNIAFFFITSLLLVILLVVIFGLIAGA